MADTEEEVDIWSSAVSTRDLVCYVRGVTSSIPHRLYLQAHAKIPDDAWEYHIRKSLNDAAYNGLAYVPYCSTMPVQKECEDPRFMWKKKGAK